MKATRLSLRATLLRVAIALGCCAVCPPRVQSQDCGCPADQPLWGFADVHAHEFANLAFGGELVAGDVYASNPFLTDDQQLEQALPCCGNHSSVAGCGADCTFDADLHGLCGIGDLLGATTAEGYTHNPSGYPNFEGWPKWNSSTHQQQYYRWLERSWVGGQRLMVMEAVDNEAMCDFVNTYRSLTPGICENQMGSIRRQIQAAKDLESYIDYMDDHVSNNHTGFYRIAYSAAEARHIISNGQLAVILGVEMSNLLGCYKDRCCFPAIGGCKDVADVTQADIGAELNALYALGIRHVHPVHVFDNAFGGAAVFDPIINAGNSCINGSEFDVYDCSVDGYEFRFDTDFLPETLNVFEGFLDLIVGCGHINWDLLFSGYPNKPSAHCNARSLQGSADLPELGETELGRWLIEGLMDRGMIIDVDHMSLRTREDVYAFAEERCYPLISSHDSFVDPDYPISRGELSHEQSRLLPWEVEEIRDLGGMVAPIMRQGDACGFEDDEKKGCIDQYEAEDGTVVDNNCSWSSRTWAQAYLYAYDRMQGRTEHLPIALGTDMVGPFEHIAPRFGDDACAGEGDAQTSMVMYPFQAEGIYRDCFTSPCSDFEECVPISGAGSFCFLKKLNAGLRDFDFNYDGLANIGLLPDFIADLKAVGITSTQLLPLFHSAGGYVEMWESIERAMPIVYVDQASTVAHQCGSGTLNNPYLHIEQAVESVKPGGYLVISPGTYNEEVYFDTEMTICGDDVIIGCSLGDS